MQWIKRQREAGGRRITHMYYLPFTFPALSPLLKQSSSALVSESSLSIYPNSQPCIPESIVLAESPWSQVVKPPACILTLPRQKSALGRFEVQRIKKMVAKREQMAALPVLWLLWLLQPGGWWLCHGFLGRIHILRIFAQSTMMLIVPHGLPRSQRGVFALAKFFYCECPIFVMFGPDPLLGFIYN